MRLQDVVVRRVVELVELDAVDVVLLGPRQHGRGALLRLDQLHVQLDGVLQLRVVADNGNRLAVADLGPDHAMQVAAKVDHLAPLPPITLDLLVLFLAGLGVGFVFAQQPQRRASADDEGGVRADDAIDEAVVAGFVPRTLDE